MKQKYQYLFRMNIKFLFFIGLPTHTHSFDASEHQCTVYSCKANALQEVDYRAAKYIQ